jgi:hypothetical protein
MSQGRPENSIKLVRLKKKVKNTATKKKKKKKKKKKNHHHVTEIRLGMAETRVEMPQNQRDPCK